MQSQRSEMSLNWYIPPTWLWPKPKWQHSHGTVKENWSEYLITLTVLVCIRLTLLREGDTGCWVPVSSHQQMDAAFSHSLGTYGVQTRSAFNYGFIRCSVTVQMYHQTHLRLRYSTECNLHLLFLHLTLIRYIADNDTLLFYILCQISECRNSFCTLWYYKLYYIIYFDKHYKKIWNHMIDWIQGCR